MKLDIQMFATDGTITIDTKVDTSGVTKGINEIEKSADKASNSSLNLGTLIKGNIISSAVIGGLSSVAGGIRNISTEFANLVVQGGLDRTLSIEQAQFKLKGLGHDAESISTIMDNALASVKGTAYGLGSAATVAASAVAAGVKPGQDLERTLSLIADASAISGRDMEEMGAIFNKVAAAGKLTGQELNQLTDSGIPVLQLLGDTMGVTAEEARDLISQGKVGFPELQNAIEQGMGGAAKTLGDTFQGSLENTKAALSRLGQSFLTPFTQSMTPALGQLIGIIDDITSGAGDKAVEKIDGMVDMMGNAIIGLIDNLSPIMETLIPVVDRLVTKILEKLPEITNKAIPLIVKVMSGFAKIIISNLPLLLNAMQQINIALMNEISKELPTLIPVIVEALIGITEVMIQNLPLFIDAGLKLLAGLTEGFTNALPIIISAIPRITNAITQALLRPDVMTSMITSGIQIMMALIEGLVNSLPLIAAMGPQIVESLSISLGNMIQQTDWGALAMQIVNTFKQGIAKMGISVSSTWTNTRTHIIDLINKIWNEFKKLPSKMINIGSNLIKGVWSGISNSKDWLNKKIKSWVGNVTDYIKKLFKIGSPSKLWRDEVGVFLAQGIGVGFNEELDGVYADMQRAINLEQAKLQANVETGKVFNSLANSTPITINLDASVEMDSQKVGRLVTPAVSETLKTGGLR